MADNFVKGIVYETNYWVEPETDKIITKCLKCGNIGYLDPEHTVCEKCGEDYGDYHHEFMDAETVEKMAWSYLSNLSQKIEKSIELADTTLQIVKGGSVDLDKTLENINILSKHHVGFAHTLFEADFGVPVESEVERKTFTFNGNEYADNIWKCGFIVNDELFNMIQNGEVNSFSFGGKGCKELLFEIEDTNTEI